MLQVHGEKGEGAEEGESPLTNSMNDFIIFFKHTDCTVRTMDHMWKIICWSLPALFDCRYLPHDVLGCSYEDGTSDAVLATTPFFVDSDTFVCCGICKDAESQ